MRVSFVFVQLLFGLSTLKFYYLFLSSEEVIHLFCWDPITSYFPHWVGVPLMVIDWSCAKSSVVSPHRVNWYHPQTTIPPPPLSRPGSSLHCKENRLKGFMTIQRIQIQGSFQIEMNLFKTLLLFDVYFSILLQSILPILIHFISSSIWEENLMLAGTSPSSQNDFQSVLSVGSMTWVELTGLV